VPSHSGHGVERARTGITAADGTSIGRSGAPPGDSAASFCRSRTSSRAARSRTRRSVRGRVFFAMPGMIACERMRHVALLRGINVGGKNKLPMTTLANLFTVEGATDVTTFIQSGNVVFDAPKKLADTLAGRIERRIEKELSLRVPVVLRSAVEIAAVVARNPFLAAGHDPDALHVMFLAAQPTPAQARALDPSRSPGDELALVGRDLYLRLPNGVARTKLTNAYVDKALATVSTVRNWRTVLKLVELAAR